MTGAGPSWIGGLVWFAAAAFLIIYGVWSWDRTAKWGRLCKTGVSAVVLLLMSLFTCRPLLRQYQAEHGPLRNGQPVIQVLVIPEDGNFEPDTKVGTITWSTRYSDALIRITNLADVALHNVDFTFRSDLNIEGMTQVSGLADVDMHPEGVPIMRLNTLGQDGRPVEIPIQNPHGSAFKVHCARLPAKTSLDLIAATVAVNPVVPGRLPSELFGRKRRPSRFNIQGGYETSSIDEGARHPISVECSTSGESTGTCRKTLLFQRAR